jgi:hypothetical protein
MKMILGSVTIETKENKQMTKFYKDDENFEWVEGSDGKLVQVIKDGGRARVSFFDAQAARMPLTDAERYVLEDARWREQTRANRAGFRYDISDTGKQRRQRVRDAYNEREREMAEAWKDMPPSSWFGCGTDANAESEKRLGGPNTKFRGEAGTGQRGSREGDICSINGAAGHLRYGEDGELYCRADGIDDLDKNSSEEAISDARRNAYADHAAYIQNAWKGPQR